MKTGMKKVKDFPGLIRWIAEMHHEGKLHPVAERAGIGWTTVHQWSRGIIRNPGIVTVWKLCAAYDLDLMDVLTLFRPPPPPRGRRKPDPLPAVILPNPEARPRIHGTRARPPSAKPAI